MKVKICLDTMTDIANFVLAVHYATGKHDQVWVTDGTTGAKINAKSFLGLVATRDFNEIWCESDKDIYTAIRQFEAE
jgi:hypothetical protein